MRDINMIHISKLKEVLDLLPNPDTFREEFYRYRLSKPISTSSVNLKDIVYLVFKKCIDDRGYAYWAFVEVIGNIDENHELLEGIWQTD